VIYIGTIDVILLPPLSPLLLYFAEIIFHDYLVCYIKKRSAKVRKRQDFSIDMYNLVGRMESEDGSQETEVGRPESEKNERGLPD
jgi:hypothetical protein